MCTLSNSCALMLQMQPRKLSVPMATTADIIKRFSTPHHRFASRSGSTRSLIQSSNHGMQDTEMPGPVAESEIMSLSETNATYIEMTAPESDKVVFNRNSFAAMSDRKLKRYPRSFPEVNEALSDASLYNPANVPMKIIQSYTPKSQDQSLLQIQWGLVVNALYKTRDWVYVRTHDRREGFVPFLCLQPLGFASGSGNKGRILEQEEPEPLHVLLNQAANQESSSEHVTLVKGDHVTSDESDESYCHGYVSGDSHSTCRDEEQNSQTVGESNKHHSCSCCENSNYICMNRNSPCNSRQSQDASLSRDTAYGSRDTINQSDDGSGTLSVSFDDEYEIEVPQKRRGGYLTVLFGYRAMNKTDVSVEHQEVVKLLNDKNPDWIWVRKENGQEGFIPRKYTVDLTLLNLEPSY